MGNRSTGTVGACSLPIAASLPGLDDTRKPDEVLSSLWTTAASLVQAFGANGVYLAIGRPVFEKIRPAAHNMNASLHQPHGRTA